MIVAVGDAAVVAIGEEASARDVVARANRLVGTDCRPSVAELKMVFGEMVNNRADAAVA